VSQQLESEQGHRAAVERSWKESQAAAARAEERVTASAAEINKGNQIIEKLQVRPLSLSVKLGQSISILLLRCLQKLSCPIGNHISASSWILNMFSTMESQLVLSKVDSYRPTQVVS
jgi:hypothetical protein